MHKDPSVHKTAPPNLRVFTLDLSKPDLNHNPEPIVAALNTTVGEGNYQLTDTHVIVDSYPYRMQPGIQMVYCFYDQFYQ